MKTWKGDLETKEGGGWGREREQKESRSIKYIHVLAS